jgi:hypothetical protein
LKDTWKPKCGHWERGIMIPACEEFLYLPDAIESLGKIPYKKVLVIVLNHRYNAPLHVKQDNQKLWDFLLAFPHQKIRDDLLYIEYTKSLNLDILLLDRIHFPLQDKQGVGIARHQGMELLCELYDTDLLRYPYFWSTDGDARFSNDYVNEIPKKLGIAICPYIHKPAASALQIYELGLRYYTLGLIHANAPNPLPTIGSLIVIHRETYRKSHGFPDRMAGEDFYLINKASKVATFGFLKRSPVQLIDRESDRVPFGTGKGQADIASRNLEHQLYSPIIFDKLKLWNKVLRTSSDKKLIHDLQKIVPDTPVFSKLQKVLRQNAKGKRIIDRRFEFFDLFQTMRWIHFLRDNYHPSIDYKEALHTASFVLAEKDSLQDLQLEIKTKEEKALLTFFAST